MSNSKRRNQRLRSQRRKNALKAIEEEFSSKPQKSVELVGSNIMERMITGSSLYIVLQLELECEEFNVYKVFNINLDKTVYMSIRKGQLTLVDTNIRFKMLGDAPMRPPNDGIYKRLGCGYIKYSVTGRRLVYTLYNY